MEEYELEDNFDVLLDDKTFDLILFNDDINTFEHVKNSLITICGVSTEHARNCTMTAHFEGECIVLNDYLKVLEPMLDCLNMVGLDCVINNNEI